MIKFSQSNMHTQANLTFFQGQEVAKSGEYFFKETDLLFAKENLAPNLIEYDTTSALPFDYLTDPLKTLIQMLKVNKGRFFNLVDVRLGQLNFDIGLYYEKKSFDELSANALESSLVQRGQFKVEKKNSFLFDCLIANIDTDAARYIQILVSEKFLHERSKALSPYLISAFNPARYVDTQIAFFLIMTTLSGSAANR